MAKLIRNRTPKNRLSRSQVSSFLTYASTCITATSRASPMVSGTKRK